MLSTQSRDLVAATADTVASRLDVITADFYRRLFTAHPQLLDGMFSRSNQANGRQSSALASSIIAFARASAAGGDAPQELIERIANRHASLGVTAAQYKVVYEHLFAAIAADLGEVITPAISAAWTEVYWLFANTLISCEHALYRKQANARFWVPWSVTSVIHRTPRVSILEFGPSDDTPVTQAAPGQYVSLRVRLEDGIRQARQYSLLKQGETRSIAVALDAEGEVSAAVHRLQAGDPVELSNPYGRALLDDDGAPLVLISAGIGCTPTASMLTALHEAGSTREVVVLHSDRSTADWALGTEIRTLVDQLQNARLRFWQTDVPDGARMTLGAEDLIDGANVHLCGPVPFMRAMRQRVIHLGVSPERVHYEVFGPDSWLADGDHGDA